MARLSRLAVAGCVHHVLQRGIDRRPIFRDAADFQRMRDDLGELCRAAGATLTTMETVVFDWLRRAGTDPFKRLSKLIR